MCKECGCNPCRPQCPNNDDEPLLTCSFCDKDIYVDDVYYEVGSTIYCEDCIQECRRTATDDNYYGNSDGEPVFSYGDVWEETI